MNRAFKSQGSAHIPTEKLWNWAVGVFFCVVLLNVSVYATYVFVCLWVCVPAADVSVFHLVCWG